MQTVKTLVHDNFEVLLILSLVLAAGTINFYARSNLLFLNFFYLPVLAAGFYLGKRSAISASLVSTLLIFFLLLVPEVILSRVTDANDLIALAPTVFVWAFFLNLTAVLVGTLYEQRNEKMEKLKIALVGVLEILSKYLESYDRYTQGHSVRVAKYATEIALAMGLPRAEVGNVRVAALLHDIGKVDVSIDLIKKSARLTEDEKSLVDQHTEKGANLLKLVGVVLDGAIPIVQAHHANYPENNETFRLPLGARIIAVADAYDAMVTDHIVPPDPPGRRSLKSRRRPAISSTPKLSKPSKRPSRTSPRRRSARSPNPRPKAPLAPGTEPLSTRPNLQSRIHLTTDLGHCEPHSNS